MYKHETKRDHKTLQICGFQAAKTKPKPKPVAVAKKKQKKTQKKMRVIIFIKAAAEKEETKSGKRPLAPRLGQARPGRATIHTALF